MNRQEVESRQNRVVYGLMGLVALAGLVWAVWQHGRAAF